MRILHVVGSTLSSGAAKGAYILHRALVRAGNDSQVLVAAGRSTDPTVSSLAIDPRDRWTRARRRLDGLPATLYPARARRIFSTGFVGIDLTRHPLHAWADIINLHWISGGMIAVRSLGRITKPIVWTLRDMWPFSGGCHYSLRCERWKSGCGACPQLGSRLPWDLSSAVHRHKRSHLPPQLRAVGISRWIAECAAASPTFRGRSVTTIENAIDTDAFEREGDPAAARHRLGLPLDARIVLFGAIAPGNFYKGGDLLPAALGHVTSRDITEVTFGGTPQDEPERRPGRIDFGYIDDDARLRDLYEAADVFVLPSIQEAFGKTAAEAMACGTPVVAFDACGPRDIVDHQRTGWLAAPFAPENLAAGIDWCLAAAAADPKLAERCALAARKRFSPRLAASRYVELYSEAIESRGEPA